jgi:hypothetical protein
MNADPFIESVTRFCNILSHFDRDQWVLKPVKSSVYEGTTIIKKLVVHLFEIMNDDEDMPGVTQVKDTCLKLTISKWSDLNTLDGQTTICRNLDHLITFMVYNNKVPYLALPPVSTHSRYNFLYSFPETKTLVGDFIIQ